MTGDQERKSVVLETWMTMDPQEERLQAISMEAVSSLAPAGNPPERLAQWPVAHLQAISKEAATSSCTLVTKEGERTEVEPTFMADLI